MKVARLALICQLSQLVATVREASQNHRRAETIALTGMSAVLLVAACAGPPRLESAPKEPAHRPNCPEFYESDCSTP